MINFTKRTFLKKTVVNLSLAAIGLIPFWKKDLEEAIQWEGTLFFPKTLSWKACCEFQNNIMNIEGLNKIEKKMKDNNSILLKHILFNGKSITWDLYIQIL